MNPTEMASLVSLPFLNRAFLFTDGIQGLTFPHLQHVLRQSSNFVLLRESHLFPLFDARRFYRIQ